MISYVNKIANNVDKKIKSIINTSIYIVDNVNNLC